MKKKLFLIVAIVAILTCLFAISVSAAEPNYNGETVTLKDGTVCPLYDTDGNAISWYVDGNGQYQWASVLTGLNIICRSGAHELNDVTVTVGETTYPNTSMVVINMRNEVITSDRNKGNTPTYIYRPFRDCKKLEYLYFHVDTTEFAGESMVGCDNLQYVNFEELTKLSYIGNQAFNGCKNLFLNGKLDLSKTALKKTDTNSLRNTGAQEVIFPTTFETMGQETFRDCANLKKVTFTASPTTINTYWTFYKCPNLEEIVGAADCFKNITSFTESMFYECKKLTKVEGLIENGVLTLSNSCTKIGTSTFRETGGIVSVTFPASITSIGGTAFYQSPSLKTVVFENEGTDISFGDDIFKNSDALETVTFKENAGITTLGVFMFYDCDKLKYLSIPDSVTRIKTSAFYSNDKLTALYLPANLTTIDKLDALFEDCDNMYFVNEFFTDPAKVEKPSVYFFPNIITEIGAGTELFKLCVQLNETIVFGDQLTAVKDGFAFGKNDGNAPANNFVFLGNMTEFAYYGGYFKNTNLYFCNPDTTIETLKVSPYSGSANATNCKVFVCASGKWADLSTREFVNDMAKENHVQNPKANAYMEATCTTAEGNFTFCFCGKELSFVKAENGDDALGHIYTNIIEKIFPTIEGGSIDYYADATYVYACPQCETNVNRLEKGTSLFTKSGFSANEEDMTDVVFIVYINYANIEAYLAENEGVEIVYGLVASANTTGTPLTYADGKVEAAANTVKVDMTGLSYNKLTMRITNVGANELHCAGYVSYNGEISYLNHETTNEEAAIVSLSIINDMLFPSEDEGADEGTEEVPAV